MYILIVKGARNSTIAYHRCETYAEIDELLAIYRALGYEPGSLIVEQATEEKAA